MTLRIISGPDHWERVAERNRRQWAMQPRNPVCHVCGEEPDMRCPIAQCPHRKAA